MWKGTGGRMGSLTLVSGGVERRIERVERRSARHCGCVRVVGWGTRGENQLSVQRNGGGAGRSTRMGARMSHLQRAQNK
jgi:hypothetical protein